MTRERLDLLRHWLAEAKRAVFVMQDNTPFSEWELRLKLDDARSALEQADNGLIAIAESLE